MLLFYKRRHNLILWDFTPLDLNLSPSFDFTGNLPMKHGQLNFYSSRCMFANTSLPSSADRQAMPDVTANLPSNNPFRKFNTSPAPPYNSLTSPGSAEIRPSAAPERPQSRNPFLDQADFGTLPRSGSPGNEMSRSNGNPSAKSGGLTVDLFVRN